MARRELCATQGLKWFTKFQDELPGGMFASLEEMTSINKTIFMISGLHNSFVPEWENVYVVICDFVVEMYACHSLTA